AFARRTAWDLRPNRWAAAVAAARQAAEATEPAGETPARVGLPSPLTSAGRTPSPPPASMGARRGLLDLTVTNPTAARLEYPRERILAAVARPEVLEYNPEPRGAPAAREAVAAYYCARGSARGSAQERPQKTGVTPGQLLLTASTSEAYGFLFRLLAEPGGRVHVPCPSYPLLDHLAAIHDLELVPYPLWHAGEWQTDLAELERSLSERSQVIVVIQPNNPTGSYVGAAAWGRLTALAARRGLAIVADEVFFDYAWAPEAEELDLARAAEAEGPPVFLLNGLSKISALPQIKLGWMAALGGGAAWRAEALARLEVMADAYLSVSAPAQAGAAELLAVRGEMQPRILARLRANLAELDRQLAGQKWVTRLSGAGGWMAVLRLPVTAAGGSGEAWAEAALAAGVLAHPGEFYGFAGGAYLVVSLLTPAAAWAEGIGRLLAAVAAEAES
ncbi:MAG: pyridoxal phosphate-dependent aminotransferase, partial [Terriglobales bacterium]